MAAARWQPEQVMGGGRVVGLIGVRGVRSGACEKKKGERAAHGGISRRRAESMQAGFVRWLLAAVVQLGWVRWCGRKDNETGGWEETALPGQRHSRMQDQGRGVEFTRERQACRALCR